ncbi:hypothetical protein F5X99DRAFT_163385 [Biscogniauxia marginata]|nr:hypothetical protein F5X99DRAFT_163385 [Biscogniauxia marginata]
MADDQEMSEELKKQLTQTCPLHSNTINGATPEDVKEKFVQHCLRTWLSKGFPMTPSEARTRQFSLGDGEKKQLDGQLILDSNPKGFFFVPFDSRPPDDPELRKEREELNAAVRAQSFAPVNALLDKEIMRDGLLVLSAIDKMNPPTLSSLKTYEKVERIAKFRLLIDSLRALRPGPKPKPVREDHIKVYLLRARGDEKLEIRDFLLSPRDGMGIFYGLLEQASNPYGNGNGALSCSTEAIEIMSNPRRKISEAEREEMRREAQMEAQFIEDMPRNWSYRLVNSSDVKRPRVFVGSEWEPVDTEDQYKKMIGLVKDDSDRSLMVTRTSRIPEARRISKLGCNGDDAIKGPSPNNAPIQEPPSSSSDTGDPLSSLLNRINEYA